MKTAVDWLVDHLYLVIPYEERNFLEGLRKEALEKEKEQIEQAFRKGSHFQAFGGSNVDTYYTETYKNQTP
jgi:hypothetical protein